MTRPFPGLSAAAWSVWGKSTDILGTDWMPLAQHLADSADVAARVWEWLPVHTRALIEADLPDNARDGQRLLQWLAGVHDIGKASPPFANKVGPLAERMRDCDQGLTYGDTAGFAQAPHGMVGQAVLTRWLSEQHGYAPKAARSYAVVVGGHHGTPPTTIQLNALKARPHLTGEGRWREVQDELLTAVSAHVGVDDLLTSWAGTTLRPTTQALLTGAVIVSDWLASNVELFPLRGGHEARAADAWTQLELPAAWRPALPAGSADDLMAKRFPGLGGLALRPVQQLAVDAAWATQTPSLLIVEAAMGSGKTEAALLAAEVLAARFGCGGVYVALPTMATSDAMFGRVLDWIAHLDGRDPTSTHLAHGKAGLNEDYRELVRNAHVRAVYDEDAERSEAVEAEVSAWLRGRKKGVLANMVVGTIDQLLFIALQAKHLALRHLAFAGKVVVVDEAHAADDYMRTFLVRTLEWLAAYGVPVIVMSATLPHAQRQELANAYRQGLGAPPVALPSQAPYPALTQVSATGLAVQGDRTEPHSQSVAVECLDDDLPTLADRLGQLLVDGGCAAVIRTTVTRAQEATLYLAERFPDTEVVLLHSRFVATHRVQREARLRRLLGRDGGERPTRLIVVGTQVLEQSLDLDFDLMTSDLAPVDLLLQRVGRLHRHERHPQARPRLLRTPRLLVTGITDWDEHGVPVPGPGLRAVYDQSRLLRSAAVLGLAPTTDGELRLPHDIRPRVEAAYADGPPGPDEWRPLVEAADRAYDERIADQRDRADRYLLRPLDDTDHLVGWLEYGGGTDAEDPRAPGASRVRDTEDGIEVIVVQRDDDGAVVHLRDGSPHAGRSAVPLHGPPNDDVARALAAATVRLPLALTNPGEFDRTLDVLEAQVHEGWQASPWLVGQLALHLDENWTARINDTEVSYSVELGLVTRRADQ